MEHFIKTTALFFIFNWIHAGSFANGQNPTDSTDAAETPCKNNIADSVCINLEKYGTCFSQTTRMQKWCPKTCGFCGEVCRDWFKLECRKWLRHQACFTHRDQMKVWCKKTCGFCRSQSPPKPPKCASSPFGCCWDRQRPAKGPNMFGCPACEDRLFFCRAFWIDCYSERNQKFMYRNCPRTCLLCNPTKDNLNRANAGPVRVLPDPKDTKSSNIINPKNDKEKTGQ